LADLGAVNITEEGTAEVFKARKALSHVSIDASQRPSDPMPKIDLKRIRSKHAEPFPIEHRVKIASTLERLALLQEYLLRRLFRKRCVTLMFLLAVPTHSLKLA